MGIRFHQNIVWESNQAQYFVNNKPVMTDSDAYLYLRYAREYREGQYNSRENDTLVYYPYHFMKRPEPVPLLSYIIARSSYFFNGNYYKAGIYLVPILASLFIIPLCLYFFKIGLPSSGIIGSLVGTFSFTYLERTSVGRIDTDALNLFFLFNASLLILLAGETEDKRKLFVLSGLCGLNMLIFTWWYRHWVFSIIYLAIFVLYLIIARNHNYISILAAVLIFILFSNHDYLLQGVKYIYLSIHDYLAYKLQNIFTLRNVIKTFTGEIGNVPFTLPPVLSTIKEAKHLSILSTLSNILSYPVITIIGIVSFVACAIKCGKRIVPLLPIVFLGFMAFQSSIRYAMFLAPFVGVGLGYIITVALEKFLPVIRLDGLRLDMRQLAICLFSLLSFILIAPLTAISFIPTPKISADVYAAISNLKDVLPKDSVVFTWWDNGYMVQDATGFPTYHDGGTQTHGKTYLIAKSFVSVKQKELYNIIGYIDNNDKERITRILEAGNTADEIVSTFLNYKTPPQRNNIHILFTKDMIEKYDSIQWIGSWDFKSLSGISDGYVPVDCYNVQNNVLDCSGMKIDLKNGFVNNTSPLKKTLFIKDGFVESETDYSNSNGSYLELIVKENNIIGVFLMSERVYLSNFNQMYLLGRFDKGLFEEVDNKYPDARVFRVRMN